MDKNDNVSIGAKGTEYGNWMSMPVIKIGCTITGVAIAAFLLVLILTKDPVASIILGVVAIGCLLFLINILRIRKALSYDGGQAMDLIQRNLMRNIDWDGKGTLLDVGCGSGALSIRCAKAYPEAKVVGIDYWGAGWDYSKAVCDKNAELEGVGDRCEFQQGDATSLDFADETFDALVSNFVYHEVRSESDKKKLLAESFRTLKKGGSFSIQDFFDREKMFGNIDELVQYLKDQGVSEIHYQGDLDHAEWMPQIVIKPYCIKDIGILWGRK